MSSGDGNCLRKTVGILASGSGEAKLWEETIWLVIATDEEMAKEKARLLCLGEEQSFKNVLGTTVTWRLEAILHVFQLLVDDVADGSEVFSRFIGNATAQALCMDNVRFGENSVND